ncbi:cryptochrome/photolyase family protein [Actinokineospora xionganensis]|uniref:Deoxyribodipyrimidine photo-lyase n=1 Tax=Actinokineospora xionganensis TaxID=2684470 RepID=A0ABR7L3J6_9PSEU|nr:deoxyribodipyrimidine photo-lyase [Actinokineospora xionganensis]MBC6447256.1 deoxyribodipyrimidine photo-lyase [Actinokineospora xionganensis]
MTAPSVVWFRRDLRTHDHPALLAAAERSPSAVGLFVLDDVLLAPAGKPRVDFLHGCLRDLNDQLGGRLMVVRGKPAEVVPRVVAEFGAGSVHVSADMGPYGRKRDAAVEAALGVEFVRTGSPYAVAPGRVRKADGEPYKVFTPFKRAWLDHGWRAPADTDASTVDWVDAATKLPAGESHGERDALRAWEDFRGRLDDYARHRDRPDLDGTSRMSAYLRWGCVHPRTLLADLGENHDVYRSELAWREFYADVLWHRPETARTNYDKKFDRIAHDNDTDLFDAWCQGKTGYPIVDAGMRQLLAEGWMHNRVRMIVASFLVKDLHLPWWWGARHFMRHLVDGDLASNQHGWQWTAGSGTDAAPYFRVFNPTSQGEKFDPNGDYVRRYVPELRDIPGKSVHKPSGVKGYPGPVVDHAQERQVALDRYAAIKS